MNIGRNLAVQSDVWPGENLAQAGQPRQGNRRPRQEFVSADLRMQVPCGTSKAAISSSHGA